MIPLPAGPPAGIAPPLAVVLVFRQGVEFGRELVIQPKNEFEKIIFPGIPGEGGA